MTEQTVSAPALPRPPEWSRRERPLWFTPCVTAAMVAGILAVTFGLDDLLAGVVLGAVAVLLLGIVLVFPLPRPILVEHGGEGVRFPFRRRSRSITLTPTAIVLARGTVQVIPWPEVNDITAWSQNFGHVLWPIRQNLITLESERPAKGLWRWLLRGLGRTIRTVRLATDPVIVYHALLFYLHHPAARVELAGEAGVERIRSGRLIPDA
ncbi:MAG TPA: hypothetical protein VGX25_17780 [Actinophytocola sp.]|uniref:hypothetical protein n=1 Tax=Actinophytocola sp. TaxID=1872138 RepID=UPI002DDD1F2C|nr:hypothetical protein [Actinophytocola sp.]HEV2781235.1 hypothetical protein [Actinophytocola sp.]